MTRREDIQIQSAGIDIYALGVDEVINDYMPVIRINAPAWYQRADFRRMLRAPGVATWHKKQAGAPSEYSDVFVTYSEGSGSNDPTAYEPGEATCDCLPEDIWKSICRICMALDVDEAVIWITNLQPAPTDNKESA